MVVHDKIRLIVLRTSCFPRRSPLGRLTNIHNCLKYSPMPLRKVAIFDDLSERLRSEVNPYVAQLKTRSSDPAFPALYGPALRGRLGQWRGYFAERRRDKQSPQQLVLEIGMHKGKTLTAMTAAHPSWAFLAMDITYKRVMITAERMQALGRDNVCAILGDARHCPELFAPRELDGVLVFFPDPWSKKKGQLHNRLLTPEFCAQLSRLLAEEGFFWLKTDCANYFAAVAGFFDGCPSMESSQEAPVNLEGQRSVFEERFLKAEVPIFQGIWRKKAAQSVATA